VADRAQAYALEGIFSAIIVITALLYGLQSVDVGPWASENADQIDEYQAQANDLLALAADNGALGEVVRCYSGTGFAIDGEAYNASAATATDFERMLYETLDNRSRSYNIYFEYWDDGQRVRRLVSTDETSFQSGVEAPGDSAAVATYTLTLYDGMNLALGPQCEQQGPTYAQLNGAPIPDVDDSSAVHNVVEVRLVVW
jgi:hypothetical protein